MKEKIKKYFVRCNYKEGADYFEVSGSLFHWSILLLPMIWAMFGALMLFRGAILNSLIFLFISLVISAGIALSSEFRIRIDPKHTSVKFQILDIPYKTINSATKDLMIRHSFKDLPFICPVEKFYAEEFKNNLRFSYILPWDGDEDIFYIDYNNKELDFNIDCNEFVWENIISGLKILGKKKLRKY